MDLDDELKKLRSEYHQFKALQLECVKFEKRRNQSEVLLDENEEEENEENELKRKRKFVNNKLPSTFQSTKYEFDDLNSMDEQHYKMRAPIKKKESIDYYKLIKGQ